MSLPVYLKVDNVLARPLRLPYYLADSKQTAPQMILNGTWAPEGKNRSTMGKILQSSFDGKEVAAHCPQRNGLIGTVMDAYATHHHLILRPDDIWIAIITQFNFYVNAHSEELRSHFVAHEGQKALHVNASKGFDFAYISKAMAEEIHNNVVDKELKNWILPAFSTTTDNDTIVSAAIMMATLKNYFTYESGITCGIPSITLEGTQKDWLDVLHRLDKLEAFGAEPAAWAALLQPVLAQFVAAFDGDADITFWKRIVNVDEYCGGGTVSGWIALFGAWTDTGSWTGPDLPAAPGADLAQWAATATTRFMLDLNHMPVGFCDVELVLIDDLEHYPCVIVAGHVATVAEGDARDTVRPQPGWFMVLKATKELQIPGKEDKLQKYKEAAALKKASGKSKRSSKFGGLLCLNSSVFDSILSLFRR